MLKEILTSILCSTFILTFNVFKNKEKKEFEIRKGHFNSEKHKKVMMDAFFADHFFTVLVVYASIYLSMIGYFYDPIFCQIMIFSYPFIIIINNQILKNDIFRAGLIWFQNTSILLASLFVTPLEWTWMPKVMFSFYILYTYFAIGAIDPILVRCLNRTTENAAKFSYCLNNVSPDNDLFISFKDNKWHISNDGDGVNVKDLSDNKTSFGINLILWVVIGFTKSFDETTHMANTIIGEIEITKRNMYYLPYERSVLMKKVVDKFHSEFGINSEQCDLAYNICSSKSMPSAANLARMNLSRRQFCIFYLTLKNLDNMLKNYTVESFIKKRAKTAMPLIIDDESGKNLPYDYGEELGKYLQQKKRERYQNLRKIWKSKKTNIYNFAIQNCKFSRNSLISRQLRNAETWISKSTVTKVIKSTKNVENVKEKLSLLKDLNKEKELMLSKRVHDAEIKGEEYNIKVPLDFRFLKNSIKKYWGEDIIKTWNLETQREINKQKNYVLSKADLLESFKNSKKATDLKNKCHQYAFFKQAEYKLPHYDLKLDARYPKRLEYLTELASLQSKNKSKKFLNAIGLLKKNPNKFNLREMYSMFHGVVSSTHADEYFRIHTELNDSLEEKFWN